jgi:hexosaminidase
MRRRGLTGERQLQGWFLHRIHEHLRDRDRTMVGWDEILQAGVAPGAVIMAWRGQEQGVAAARAGYDVVMTPQASTYLDLAQSDDPAEPLARAGTTSLGDVYRYEPLPADLEPEHRQRVRGSQCQLWTEHVPTGTLAEYFYFPRACAFAQAVWSSSGRDYDDFSVDLRDHLARLDALGVNYRPLDGPTRGQSRIWRPPASTTAS